MDGSDLPDGVVELLFGIQPGGADINQALAVSQGLVEHSHGTIMVLPGELDEGGNREQMVPRTNVLIDTGVQVAALPVLNDHGAASFNRHLAGLGIPAFACTLDQFPGLMAAVIQRQDLNTWAAAEGIALARSHSTAG